MFKTLSKNKTIVFDEATKTDNIKPELELILSGITGKSVKLLLFEFEKDNHPRTFKRWINEEQKRKTGKLVCFVCGAPDITPIIELIDGQLVETPFPQALRIKLLSEQ